MNTWLENIQKQGPISERPYPAEEVNDINMYNRAYMIPNLMTPNQVMV
jgi:hypothetical protein